MRIGGTNTGINRANDPADFFLVIVGFGRAITAGKPRGARFRIKQVSQSWHRAIVQIGGRRPNAIEWWSLIAIIHPALIAVREPALMAFGEPTLGELLSKVHGIGPKPLGVGGNIF